MNTDVYRFNLFLLALLIYLRCIDYAFEYFRT